MQLETPLQQDPGFHAGFPSSSHTTKDLDTIRQMVFVLEGLQPLLFSYVIVYRKAYRN